MAEEEQEEKPSRATTRDSIRWSIVKRFSTIEKQARQAAVPVSEEVLQKYKDYPLVQSMLSGESTRKKALIAHGRKQIEYVKGNDTWLRTLLVIEGRALDKIILPWLLVTVNAVVWTCVAALVLINYGDAEEWEFFIGIVLNTSLSFLLVFRLNRAAERFWLARESWGVIVGDTRHLVSGIQTHARHDRKHLRIAVEWVAAFSIATMQYMRSIPEIPPEMLAGILDPTDVKRLASSPHPPLYAADRVRAALKAAFCVTVDTPTSLAIAWTEELNMLEKTLNNIMDCEGTMERIRSQPLPVVYVAHLRMFLLLFLLVLPYIWYPALRWGTIPAVCISAFALLGLEGAAIEVEAPFKQDRPNHLDMDSFCLVIMNTIQQTLRDAADREIDKRSNESAQGSCKDQDKKGDGESQETGGDVHRANDT